MEANGFEKSRLPHFQDIQLTCGREAVNPITPERLLVFISVTG